MYTDDHCKQSYLDIHCNWVERDYSCHHAALAVRHFGHDAHTAQNIQQAISNILSEYGISDEETPVTTDHGSNIISWQQIVCRRLSADDQFTKGI